MKASETDNAEEECKDLYDITPRMFPCPAQYERQQQLIFFCMALRLKGLTFLRMKTK
jgi:hypothetical protein